MFRDLIAQGLENKGLNQTELTKECKKLNANFDSSLISKILNKGVIPNEDISKALANVLEIDEELLILEGYLEKAPEFLLDYLDDLFINTFDIGMSLYDNIDTSNIPMSKDTKNKIKQLFNYNGARAQCLLEMVRCDLGILYDDNSKMQLESKADKFVMNFGNEPIITVDDNSMEPIIPKNSKIKLWEQSQYENNDTVCVLVKGKKLIRNLIVLGNNYFLYPLNKQFKSQILTKKECTIMGKVSSYTCQL